MERRDFSQIYYCILFWGGYGYMEPGYILLFGRLHPLILHFPVALLMLAAFLEVLPRLSNKKFGAGYNLATWVVLCFGALSAVIAASMGLTLAASGSYDGAAVASHKFFGLSVATLACLSVLLKLFAEEKTSGVLKILYSSALSLCVVAIFIAGHYGGNLTHGSEFLPSAAPEPIASWLREEKDTNIIRASNDQFSQTIEPIITEHCVSCHGDSKQEGGLRFDDHDVVMAGGESGIPAIVPGKALSSEMVRRLFLPRSDKKAMPPDGRSRPSDAQLVTIMDWIEAGAPCEGESSGPSQLMADYLGQDAVPATNEALAALDEAGVVYYLMSEDNPLLNVDLSLKTYDTATIEKLLSPIAEQVAWLNLSFNEIDEDTIRLVSKFPNLTRLSLAETGVDDSMLRSISDIDTLTSLNLTGNPVTAQLVEQFKDMPALLTLYIWDTAIEGEDAIKIKDSFADVNVILGGNFILPSTDTE